MSLGDGAGGTANYGATATDTDPRAARVQVEVWRRMGCERRSRAMAEMSESLRKTVRDQIVAARPQWSARQVTLALVARLPGPQLAARANGGVPVPDP